MNTGGVNREVWADISIPRIGAVRVTASDNGITGIRFMKRCAGVKAVPRGAPPVLHRALHELRLYAQGRLQRFTVPVDISGVTGFTRLVLERTATLPYGTTISYGQLASSIGRRGAGRAAGNSLGKNPVPIIIPCHRVIRADGSAGGYSSGVRRKKLLLALEGIPS